MDQGVAIKALGDLARGIYGPTLAGPQRLLAAGPWRRPGETFVPAPRPAERSICPRHRGQPAGHCRVCASERIERLTPPEQEATPTTPMRAKAIAAARETLRASNARWAEVRRAHRHKTALTTV